MKELRIECDPEFFEEMEDYLFRQAFEEKPELDQIELETYSGARYYYQFEYQFGFWRIVTK